MKKYEKYIIWFFIILFGLIYGIFSVVRHLKLETYIFDLGYYDQLLWLAAHGKSIYSSILEAHPWVDHFSPSIFLLTPLYWIWDNAIILLIFQSFFISLGAYPIYLLAYKKTKKLLFSLTLAFCYLIFYGIQNAVAYDFHAVALGPTLLSFIFWFYEEKKYLAFWLTLIIFVGLQENFFALTSAYGIFLILAHKDYKRGLIISSLSIFFLLSLLFYIIPNFFEANYYYIPHHLGKVSFLETFKMLYLPSSKIDVVVFSFTAFGFLPIFAPAFFVLLLEEFLGRFLATTNPNWWILGFHYNAILAPIMAFATITAVQKYFSKKEGLVIFLLLTGTIISQFRVKPDIIKMAKKDYYDLSNTKIAKNVLKLIPPDVSVAATNNLGAQITHRENLIFLTNCKDNPNIWGPDGKRCFKLIPDYIVADLDPNGSNNNFYPDYSRESIIDYLNYLQESGRYKLLEKAGDVYLLTRNDGV